MRIVYFGTPPDAVPPLEALVSTGHDIAFVVTQPDRRRSRGAGSDPSPVKAAALELGLEVKTPERAKEIIDDVANAHAALGVVVAFGQLLPVGLLEATTHGFVNVHFSLLPRWRGAAPVERAILAGDAETGVCLMGVEAGLDTGPVYACESVAIGADETAGELRDRLVASGTRLLVEQIDAIPEMVPTPQEGDATYAEKLTVDEFKLDPALPAAHLARIVRAGNPRPGAWGVFGGKRVKVCRAHPELDADVAIATVDEHGRLGTSAGALVFDEVQPEGKRPMRGADWRRGLRGDVLIAYP